MMTECLSQENVRALADGKATTTVESGGYVLQKVSLDYLLPLPFIDPFDIFRGLATMDLIFGAGT